MKKGGGGGDISDDEYKALMDKNKHEIEEMKKSYEEKLKQAQTIKISATGATAADIQKQKAKYPHIFNLNMDPMLNATIVHIIKSGKYKIGSQKGSKSDIILYGPSILEQHAVIRSEKSHLKV